MTKILVGDAIAVELSATDEIAILHVYPTVLEWVQQTLSGQVEINRRIATTAGAAIFRADPDLPSMPAEDDALLLAMTQHSTYKSRKTQIDEAQQAKKSFDDFTRMKQTARDITPELTNQERAALGILRAGMSYEDAAEFSKLNVEQVQAAWARSGGVGAV